MTNDDIIKTAFKVWGRELYRTTSLTDIARELGVSKPALYRHFKDKDALVDAMYPAFFDNCADFIKKDYERAIVADNWQESSLIIMRAIAEYYIRNPAAFVFAHFKAYSSMNKEYLDREFRKRGIDLRCLGRGEGSDTAYPSKIQLSMMTLIFSVSYFLYDNYKPGEIFTDELVSRTLAGIEGWITKGLGLDARGVNALDYRRLEEQAEKAIYEDTEDNKLLKAVAGAVAEAGPWNASMEMVARRSGLSKSGLYAHFKNRQDMLSTLFITEFTRIANSAKTQIETTEMPEEQIYLTIVSIVNYLRTRPEILVAIDWIKNRQLELGKEVSGRLYQMIGEIKLEAVRKQDQHWLVRIAQWILFLIVNTLAWWSREDKDNSCFNEAPDHIQMWAKNAAEIPNESLRVLFRYISLGLEGLTNE
jgi:AcrR family transcriptional regulator